ncbi:hypothetical protein LRS11_18045 [Pseudomonas sp. J452]|uniref:DUF6957 family protein n=1 Tax=Pseudomonas sp. J452 TaxID=2898441 RepID=UPI0021AD5BF9|nr:hypothetical protein [Pseudomonas sp. J452]UUY07702.1 hypothetical protein LRS11_18045 [Pseudomonas sp. J452]
MKTQPLDISEDKRVNEILDFIYGEAPVIRGTNLNREEIREELRRRNPKKQYCLVKDWILVELDISNEARKQIEDDGLIAQFIHAHEIIEDSSNRWPAGYWVRTSLQLRYENDGFFETRSTIYVLLGDGRHKRVPEDIAYSIRP